jgi:hypothetical protein
MSHIQTAHGGQYAFFRCKTEKWLLAGLANFMLRLGGIVKINVLGLKRRF